MSTRQWKSRLDASQAQYLPLITSCLLVVQILAAVRDPIVLGALIPSWMVLLNLILILIVLLIFILVRMRVIPYKFSDGIIMIALLCIAVKAISAIILQAQPLPLYMAVLLFAYSLCFLSSRIMLLTSAITVVTWAVLAPPVLKPVEVIATFTVMLVTIGLGYLVIRRRINTMIHVYELEQKLDALQSILPMCASCKKTRDAEGNWKSIEEYVQEQQAGLRVSHGVCPVCTEDLYGDIIQTDGLDR